MAGCCGHDAKFDGVSPDYKWRLWVVIALNATMFAVEMTAGRVAASQALQADALDFAADAMTYGLSLAVIGASLRLRSTAALVKAFSLLVMGLWVFGSTLYRVFFIATPTAEIMGGVALLALATNLASVALLARYKEGDANVRSVWLCSRNDAIGNLAVMIAALGVWGTITGWPDLAVAALMAGLFLSSAVQILQHALAELRHTQAPYMTRHGGRPMGRICQSSRALGPQACHGLICAGGGPASSPGSRAGACPRPADLSGDSG